VPLFLMGHSMVRALYFYISAVFILVRSRAVLWYCRSQRVPIRRRASRSYRALLRQVPVFASPSHRRVSHAGSVASPAPSFRTRTYQRPLTARYVASSSDLFLWHTR
jgi:hypothetical protein